jgi:hypothetical protein
MNWLTLTLLGTVAAWFAYSYWRSRRQEYSEPEPSKAPPLALSGSAELSGTVTGEAKNEEDDKAGN